LFFCPGAWAFPSLLSRRREARVGNSDCIKATLLFFFFHIWPNFVGQSLHISIYTILDTCFRISDSLNIFFRRDESVDVVKLSTLFLVFSLFACIKGQFTRDQ